MGKDTDPNGLEFQHNVEKLNQSLREKGYKEVENLNSAEEIIYFDYGIEKEFERVERYRQPDVGFAISVGNSYHHRYSPFWSEFGYTHYTTYQKRRIYYNRYITILSKKPQGKELWRVDASTIGESKNLKKIVPMLIEASVDYIGKNSEEPIKIIMKEKLEKKIDKKE